MLKTGTRIVAAISILLPFSGGMAAGAQPASAPAAAAPASRAPAAETRLSIGEIAARVEAQGYRDIEEIEREGDGYEVCAKDAQGRDVELEVNGTTGRVEKVEPCDD